MSARAGGTLWVEGVALWSGLLPGWEIARAVLRGEAPPPERPAPRPAPALLAPTERRRAPDTVAIALEVAAAACASAAREPRALPAIFASTHGDLAISDYMCDTLAKTPALISPIRFHNSVHNAAAGYWSIGTGCLAPYTALSAWTHTFGSALLEAIAQLATAGAPVLLVAYDVEARGPMASVVQSRSPLGVGLVLAAERGERARARLDWRLRAGAAAPFAANPQDDPARFAPGSPLAGCLALFAALARDGATTVVQSAGPRLALELEVAPLAPRPEAEPACQTVTT